jgi:hypothetical protein
LRCARCIALPHGQTSQEPSEARHHDREDHEGEELDVIRRGRRTAGDPERYGDEPVEPLMTAQTDKRRR